jgi:hypothetical protein
MSIHAEQGPARPALRLAGLLVVLAGLFGMHGLDSHGAAGTEAVAHAGMTEPAVAGLAAGHHPAPMVMTVRDGAAAVVSAAAATHHPAMEMAMAGACLAVLAVALIALLRFLRTNRVRPVLWVLPRRARAPGHAGRDPDPPSLIDLSIQRC